MLSICPCCKTSILSSSAKEQSRNKQQKSWQLSCIALALLHRGVYLMMALRVDGFSYHCSSPTFTSTRLTASIKKQAKKLSGACFKDISNSETFMLKHRLLCKWCQTAAQNIAPYKIPNANNSRGADREVERQTFPSYS